MPVSYESKSTQNGKNIFRKDAKNAKKILRSLLSFGFKPKKI